MRLSDLNPHAYSLSPEIEANLQQLLEIGNQFEAAYGHTFIVTSGLRSLELQQQLIRDGKSNAPQSKHLFGQAFDVADPDRNLMKFVLENLELATSLGLYFEDFRWTFRKGGIPWVHIQSVAPKSGHRIFIPSAAASLDPSCWNGVYDKKWNNEYERS